MSSFKIYSALLILSILVSSSLAHNTISILSCRATKCFEDYYACHSNADCLTAYNKMNTCMQTDCLAAGTSQAECYSKCKQQFTTNSSELAAYVTCTETQCSSQQFYSSCGDAYQGLLKEQQKNTNNWKNFSKQLNKCVASQCSSSSSGSKDRIHCQMKSSAECAKQLINSFRHVSFLNAFYECTSEELVASLQGEEQEDTGFVGKILGLFGF